MHTFNLTLNCNVESWIEMLYSIVTLSQTSYNNVALIIQLVMMLPINVVFQFCLRGYLPMKSVSFF